MGWFSNRLPGNTAEMAAGPPPVPNSADPAELNKLETVRGALPDGDAHQNLEPLSQMNASSPCKTAIAEAEGHDFAPGATVTEPVDAVELALGAAWRQAIEEMNGKIAALNATQHELHQLFEGRLSYDAVQAKALEHLHDQLQAYKANFLRQALLPLLKEVISCFDFVASCIEHENSESVADGSGRALEHLRHILLDILFKYDIEPFRGEGEIYDRKTQQCLKTVATEVESEEKSIASRGAIGFRQGETIIRKEQVTVYKGPCVNPII